MRLWTAATDRAIREAQGSLSADAVGRLKESVAEHLESAARLLAPFEGGSRPDRVAAAGRLVDAYGSDAGDLERIGAVTVRRAVEEACHTESIDSDTASRLGAAAHGYWLDLSAGIDRIARESGLSTR